jgi:hypothetical protein
VASCDGLLLSDHSKGQEFLFIIMPCPVFSEWGGGGGSFSGIRQPESEADHLSSSGVKVNMNGIFLCSCLMVFWHKDIYSYSIIDNIVNILLYLTLCSLSH